MKHLIAKDCEIYIEENGQTVERTDIGGISPESQKMAVLFAAAPELLEALQNLLKYTENNCEKVTKNLRIVENNAKAAIQKATKP